MRSLDGVAVEGDLMYLWDLISAFICIERGLRLLIVQGTLWSLLLANWMVWPIANLVNPPSAPWVADLFSLVCLADCRLFLTDLCFLGVQFAFGCVPRDYRILYSNIIGVAWCTYMSVAVNAPPKIALPLEDE